MKRSPIACTIGAPLFLIVGVCVCPPHALQAVEYHAAKTGNDAHPGTQSQPFATISAAAAAAQPGDVITVHEGVYRERINPPRGGSSAEKRIVYQAAKGETVRVRGSEVVTGWKKVANDTWKVTLPDAFFGQFNPFKQLITGDWFSPKGRVHHLGAVYLDGHWLTEAATLDEVLAPAGETPLWYTPAPTAASDLLNVAWFQPQKVPDRVSADGFSAQQGIKTMVCREGGRSIGWIDDGDWVRYDSVDCGAGSEQIEFRASSQSGGGTIEIRLDKPGGSLLGACTVEDTGNQQVFKSFTAKIQPTQGRRTICLVFRSGRKDAAPVELEEGATTIWAQFKGVDPNQGNVEINVREAVFYPERTGVNFITVRGFTLEHAAPNWAPPTAEQVGLIGTHWSKGWIIEDNTIRYSICTGVSLGKYGDDWDNRAQSAEGYVGTINRGLANGWSKENIGHHVVPHKATLPVFMAGNIFLKGAKPSKHESNPLVRPDFDPAIELAEQSDGVYLQMAVDPSWQDAQRQLVTTEILGKASGPDLPYEQPDGSPYRIDTDYFGAKRSANNPAPGPFRSTSEKELRRRVWPQEQR